jgi:hypothetical protein
MPCLLVGLLLLLLLLQALLMLLAPTQHHPSASAPAASSAGSTYAPAAPSAATKQAIAMSPNYVTSADCPADTLLSNATVCRAANGLVPEQKCTGTSAACPGYGSNVSCAAQTVPESVDAATGEALAFWQLQLQQHLT